ncbi:minichromosome maintenance protein 5 [Coelomomyces lativittatus]|nr:minichromosome maintenance protein 5 [Coelomomyces lativittatus]KAJ1514602.1 minichromosome maintenance protein 5 [Coelomomyces lativittatus]
MAASFGWDQGAIFTTAVTPADEQVKQATFLAHQNQFFDFIQQFNVKGVFLYRDQLHRNLMMQKHFIDIQLDHLYVFNANLADSLKKTPSELLPLFELAAQKSAKKILFPNANANDKAVPAIQVTLSSSDSITSIRDVNASSVGKLIQISGIVIGASTLSAKATSVHLMCRSCRHIKVLPIHPGFSGIQLPRVCDGPSNPGAKKDCSIDPYVIIHDKCSFVDQQSIKVQEAPDVVPVGELPRHMVLSADRCLVNRVMPGTRVTILGIYAVVQHKGMKSEKTKGAVAIRTPYLRVVGMEVPQDDAVRGRPFTAEEEEHFLNFSRRPQFHREFARSIAPSIFGHEDVKLAVACLLFGGSRKVLSDGLTLRGDINVLLLGDPGVAKSQLLKFVEQVAPLAVYTSGKGSSAAGLTASVIRDPSSRDFYLEGGAMVLADGGVVCIDEFDKMREEDRVAIHEAMEQQTISIAKAGITTMLNSRTSVLAAANPIFGRYDDLKTPGENIDFQSTILSRFDMIFILKDMHDEASDQRIARHVMGIHKQTSIEDINQVDFDIKTMKRYISYAKSRCAPRLSEEAAQKLSSFFVQIRSDVRDIELRTGSRAAVPITVRQLEAVIRISESFAKMVLSSTVTESHVDEAIRLFQISTMYAVESGSVVEDMSLRELKSEIRQIEDELQRRLPIGSQITIQALLKEYHPRGISDSAVHRALRIMVDRGTLQFRFQRKVVVRVGV